ncbi:hypothetical protein HMPREF9577_01341 [Cutibacterium acnes HL110PA3]|nr:hypothetical protein HMPREF9603_00733 [Cutibacterium acnes HL001PA1]EFT26069.1 hypothetical protein HMPREF9577_01341 [Cutibacterium acnes HL110PA3]
MHDFLHDHHARNHARSGSREPLFSWSPMRPHGDGPSVAAPRSRTVSHC